MQTINRIRLGIVLFVIGAHGLLLYSIGFTIQTEVQSVPVSTEKVIRLVNILEEAPPPLPKPPVQSESPGPKPSVQRENPPDLVLAPSEAVAEILIETEVFTPAPVQSAELIPVPEHTQRSGSPLSTNQPDTGNKAEEAAAKTAYIKHNLDYIQRRIRNKLVYPAQARRAGIEGVTEVIFTIHLDGGVSGVSVKTSSGQKILDQAAIDAIYGAAPFRPPPVQAVIAAPVTFKLR
jgi:protein TonB